MLPMHTIGATKPPTKKAIAPSSAAALPLFLWAESSASELPIGISSPHEKIIKNRDASNAMSGHPASSEMDVRAHVTIVNMEPGISADSCRCNLRTSMLPIISPDALKANIML